MESTSVYLIIKKKHLLFDDCFTMTMCTAVAMMSSFIIALDLELLLSGYHPLFSLLPNLVGLFIGWKFDSIIKAPASHGGIYNGIMGGIMGTMLGAILQNPALCKIPIETESMIATNMYSLAIFTACLHAVFSRLIRYSYKV